MKHFLKLLLGVVLSMGTIQAQDITGQLTPLHTLSESIVSEIKTITLSDGEETTGRICLPKNESIHTIVVAVHGTGPFTYITQRQGFNYYDVLADGFCEKGVVSLPTTAVVLIWAIQHPGSTRSIAQNTPNTYPVMKPKT